MNYKSLPEMAAILTNNNAEAIADAELMAKGFDAFYSKNQDWCDNMDYDGEDDILQIFAYWFVGYDRENGVFGSYNDWQDSAEEVFPGLDEAVENLGYPINTEEIEIAGEDDIFVPEAMDETNVYLNNLGYTLIYLDTDGDCYHFFIVPSGKFARLKELGGEIGFKFYKNEGKD